MLSSSRTSTTATAVVLAALLLGQTRESEAFSSSCSLSSAPTTQSRIILAGTFYNDFEGYNVDDDKEDEKEEDDDDDDDEFLLVDDRDWRTFRKNLSLKESKKTTPSSVSVENEEVLETQSKELFKEYKQGIWAHETSLVCVEQTDGSFLSWSYPMNRRI